MRIVTWNLCHNQASRVWPRLHHELGADIILLQETAQPNWDGAIAWKSTPHHDRGSAVLAAKGSIKCEWFEEYEGWVTGGELVDSGFQSASRPLFVFSVHSPSSNKNVKRRSYVEEVVAILSLIEQRVPKHADLIIGGDFNFVSLGHRRAEESIATTSAEAGALQRFEEMGLVSCWSTAHPRRALPQTLRWNRDTANERTTPYHCDGIFVPKRWQEGLVCEVLSSACFEVSDHYPVMTWIARSESADAPDSAGWPLSAGEMRDKPELVLQLGAEGGAATFYRTPSASGGWQFHHQSSSMSLDENDDEVWQHSKSSSHASLREAIEAVFPTSDWLLFHPLTVHPDYGPAIWDLAQETAKHLPDHQQAWWQKEKQFDWQRVCFGK